ncbi:Reverse transcriptase, partial [Phytophthora palmivora]
RKAYRLLEVSDGSIVISRSVTFAEAPTVKVPRDAMEGVFDITNDDDAEDINNEAGAEEGFRTPPTRPRQEPACEEHDGSSHSVPTRGSSTPGRDGEEEWMVRPVGKRRGVVPSHYSNHCGLWGCIYCLHTEDNDGERAVTYDEVMKSKYNGEWLRAMESEMKSLEDHQTWTLVDMPSDEKAIGCKWGFRIKRDPNGNIVKFKARLVAKGFPQ